MIIMTGSFHFGRIVGQGDRNGGFDFPPGAEAGGMLHAAAESPHP